MLYVIQYIQLCPCAGAAGRYIVSHMINTVTPPSAASGPSSGGPAAPPAATPGSGVGSPSSSGPTSAPSTLPASPGPNPEPDISTLFPQARGESDRAFEAFRAYLELGPKRRYATVGRKVGAGLRTVQRWARDFDWRGRIKTYAAQCADEYTQTENTLQREALLDAAARAKTFRDRQYALAEAILDAAERHLERLEDDDLDVMSFADACKALEVASRFTRQAAGGELDDASVPDRGLRDQLTALLDQVCGETSARNRADNPPRSPTPPQPQS